ncbi:MAG TPA: CHAT domain-containing protein [Vicinamibacterales bacterium]|nr:CHAT domain-containing protein [Vicinamibacterales bacterium]
MGTRLVGPRSSWNLRRVPVAGRVPRRGGGAVAGAQPVPAAFLQSDAVHVSEVLTATPAPTAARRAAPPALELEVDTTPGEARVLAVRHPSGALTFHTGVDNTGGRRGGRRRAGSAPSGTTRFQVAVRRVSSEAGRRGAVSKALQVAVLDIGKSAFDAAVRMALPKLAARWEQRVWTERHLQEGWFKVQPAGGGTPGLTLTKGTPPPGERSLLLLHGTFSHAASGFGSLASTSFFEAVRPLYGDRIYAFNHFTVSRTPDENAAQLLAGLPDGEHRLDVITHSRGGLVLRSLVEHRALHGAPADRFTLGHAVLVASPNDGTPLATPDRWEQTVGWFANLMEVLPETPFTTGAEFVSEAIVWLATHVASDLPGLRAMDRAGDLVAGLQSPPGPPPHAYSALVSNYHPDDSLLARAVDVGVDGFFDSANDLVVPSEGGWRIDRDGASHIPAARIGCFGAGGNIDTSGTGVVNHVTFFGRPETAAFLANALAGRNQPLRAIDPGTPLPDRRFRRAAGARPASAATEAPPPDSAGPAPAAAPGAPMLSVDAADLDIDTFHLVVMNQVEPGAGKAARISPREDTRFARIFASYGGARVTEMLRLTADSGGAEPKFAEIEAMHQRIKNYTNREQGSLPEDDDMVTFGGLLFDTLFQGDVRRLYDEARARQGGRKLDLVLTSMLPSIGDKPWEFAYDSGRKSFLATEEIHFVRNVLTNIPADPIARCRGPLRILVASAQPVGFGQLSTEQELEVIRRGFGALIEAGLVTVDVLPRATPASIHGHLSTGHYSVVHFIGHGVFDDVKNEGCLIFEDERGGEFPLGERSVREIFCKRGLSLVFLNACQSGQGSRADFNKGVAQALVSHGLPALVANQYSVLDSSATSFAQHFYWALAQGMTFGQAAREARIAVNYSLHGELIDWAVPVLYARDPNRALCETPATPTTVPPAMVQKRSRRATRGRQTRVAVWDMDDVFPSLEQTLDRMNAAQGVFGFELVDMSVPLDVWDLESEKGKPYLYAERLARRLQSKPVELHANLLVCVTRHWLRDDNWLNLYGWWPEDHKPPVVIFSCAGLDMDAEGPDTDRAIANVMVSTLAGFFGNLASHARGPKSCPLYTNTDRDLTHIFESQAFDPGCRRKLAGKLGAQMPALDALLKIF